MSKSTNAFIKKQINELLDGEYKKAKMLMQALMIFLSL